MKPFSGLQHPQLPCRAAKAADGRPLPAAVDNTICTACPTVQHAHDGKENDGADDSSPELEQRRSKRAAAPAADKRRSEPAPGASKKPRASSAHASGAAAATAPNTEAKPLSERLAANRGKREAQADLDSEEGSPALKKPKPSKAKSAPGMVGGLQYEVSRQTPCPAGPALETSIPLVRTSRAAPESATEADHLVTCGHSHG